LIKSFLAIFRLSGFDMSSAKYSIYPSFRVRVISHFLAWVFIFALFVITSRALFKTDPAAPPVLIYSVLILLMILLNHYMLSSLQIYHTTKLKRWLLIAAGIVCLYVCSALVTISSLKLIAAHFPEYEFFSVQSKRRGLKTFGDIFSYSTFVWVLTVVIFYNLLLLFIKFAKNSYESNVNNTLLVSENMRLELDFLRSQIQPHFLFNTLNNIYGLVLDNQRASTSILKLSDLLRFSLYESKSSYITLKRENEFLAGYIDLEQMRHHKRTEINYDCKGIENDQLKIAPLLLVNFIENAFKHGINASLGSAWVNIKLETVGNVISFTIENSKPENDDAEKTTVAKGGLGLMNTKRRLDLIYPDQHSLTIKETEKTYFVQLNISAS